MPDALSPENAAAGAATLDSRLRGNDEILSGNDEILSGNDGILNTTLRGNDKIPVIPAQAGISGGEGLAFGDYVRREQVRLLFALDNALSQKAEDALLQELPAVKKAQVQLQSKLGGRKGNLGINLIGAIDEAGNRAFGWQLRAFAGQKESKGINAGLFYRTISGGMLHGVNAFADYEDGDYGAFFRYGIGGEVRHSLVAFSANYYLPTGGDRRVNATIAAFSREGFDAKLRLNAPRTENLKVALDYYHFGGKGNTEKEKGFRWGVELNPIPALHVGVLYDSESEKFGGDIAYHFPLDEGARQNNSPSFPQNSPSFLRRQESITEFTPDLFAPVSREYGQRIATAAIITMADITAPQVNTSIVITPQMTITNAMTVAAVTTTTTMTVHTLTATRAASVLFTVRQEIGAHVIVATTRVKFLVTLPAATLRPWALVIPTSRNVNAELVAAADGDLGYVIMSDRPTTPVGAQWPFENFLGPFTITIAEGSEDIISVAITLTTENTMTMAAISTTTRITTFATATITPGANAAIGDIPPMDSRPLVIPAQAGISQTTAAKAAHAQKEIPAVAAMTGYMTDFRLRGNDGESAAMGEMSPPSSFSRQRRGNLPS